MLHGQQIHRDLHPIFHQPQCGPLLGRRALGEVPAGWHAHLFVSSAIACHPPALQVMRDANGNRHRLQHRLKFFRPGPFPRFTLP